LYSLPVFVYISFCFGPFRFVSVNFVTFHFFLVNFVTFHFPKCIDKRSKNWLDRKVHITPKTQAYDLCSLLFNIIAFVECPSCPDWKENIIKIMMNWLQLIAIRHLRIK
jgi:hypothetical protein